MKQTISFIICKNGYGHVKRVGSVVEKLLKLNPELHINLFCSGHIYNTLSTWPNFSNLAASEQVSWEWGLVDNAINWLDNRDLSYNAYSAWADSFRNHPMLDASDLIISDNYVAPLKHYPRAVLMGSFLWHDIAAGKSPEERAIIKAEQELLESTKPFMLCVEDMAMPAVINNTKAVPLPWFCERETEPVFSPAQNPDQFRILVTGGGTSQLDIKLATLVTNLRRKGFRRIYTDGRLQKLTEVKKAGAELFPFTTEAFSSLDLVVCRPGIGILTDCVKYCIPVAALEEPGNKEMMHNAGRVSQLGLGFSLRQGEDITSLLTGGNLHNCFNTLLERKTGGASAAARYISSLLS